MYSSQSKGVYTPKCFIPHAASLRQAFAHCARFPTAASRRSLDRVSVPVWLIILSDQLPVFALVGHYPANKHDGTRADPSVVASMERPPFPARPEGPADECGISNPFGLLSPAEGYI